MIATISINDSGTGDNDKDDHDDADCDNDDYDGDPYDGDHYEKGSLDVPMYICTCTSYVLVPTYLIFVCLFLLSEQDRYYVPRTSYVLCTTMELSSRVAKRLSVESAME